MYLFEYFQKRYLQIFEVKKLFIALSIVCQVVKTAKIDFTAFLEFLMSINFNVKILSHIFVSRLQSFLRPWDFLKSRLFQVPSDLFSGWPVEGSAIKINFMTICKCQLTFNWVDVFQKISETSFFSTMPKILESRGSSDCLSVSLRVESSWFVCLIFEESTCHAVLS